jgi:hypothetical protein
MIDSRNRIDEYAKSMFRFESLHPAWITRCARYLSSIFGDEIKGCTVIDYAFGRGNWSLAFLEAGASRVIAVDASTTNVASFADYLKEHGIKGVDVREGNILEEPINETVDILWAYGIIHHISDPQNFLSLLTDLVHNDSGMGLIYTYNNNSLRQAVVELARQALQYETYNEFLDDSFLFSHHARLRVRDDLTAPCIHWHSRTDLWNLALGAGVVPKRFVPTFQDFEHTGNKEFAPHHLLFTKKSSNHDLVEAIKERDTPLSLDNRVIMEFGAEVFKAVDPKAAKKLAVGLVNNHFSVLAHGGYEGALVEDFLFLLYAYSTLGLSPQSDLQSELFCYARGALRGSSGRIISGAYNNSLIVSYLSNNTIRI